jgi:hypothetical protein
MINTPPKLTAFVELEAAVRTSSQLSGQAREIFSKLAAI